MERFSPGHMVVVGILLGSVGTFLYRKYWPIHEDPFEGLHPWPAQRENQEYFGARKLTAYVKGNADDNNDWSVLFDSQDVRGKTGDVSHEKSHRRTIKEENFKVTPTLRSKENRAETLKDELSVRKTLHTSVLCEGRDTSDVLSRAVKVTWGQGHASQMHYFHTSNHQQLFGKGSKGDIYTHGEKKQLPGHVLKYLCSNLVDEYKWFLLVTDKTYVKIRFLEEYLKTISDDKGYLLGRWFTDAYRNLANQGQIGLILSKALLQAMCPYTRTMDAGGDVTKTWYGQVLGYVKLATSTVHTKSFEHLNSTFVLYGEVAGGGVRSQQEMTNRLEKAMVIGGIASASVLITLHELTINQYLLQDKHSLAELEDEVADGLRQAVGTLDLPSSLQRQFMAMKKEINDELAQKSSYNTSACAKGIQGSVPLSQLDMLYLTQALNGRLLNMPGKKKQQELSVLQGCLTLKKGSKLALNLVYNISTATQGRLAMGAASASQQSANLYLMTNKVQYNQERQTLR